METKTHFSSQILPAFGIAPRCDAAYKRGCEGFEYPSNHRSFVCLLNGEVEASPRTNREKSLGTGGAFYSPYSTFIVDDNSHAKFRSVPSTTFDPLSRMPFSLIRISASSRWRSFPGCGI